MITGSPYYNMMTGSCRERWVGRVDPNVADENFLWICRNRGDVTNWPEFYDTPGEEFKVYPSGTYVSNKFNTSTLPIPFAGFEQGPGNMSGWSFFAGPVKTTGRTSELYFRMIFCFTAAGAVNGSVMLAGITEQNGANNFMLFSSATGTNGYQITLQYRDVDGVARSLGVTRPSRSTNAWIDVKVFIPAPANGASTRPELYVTDYMMSGSTATTPLRAYGDYSWRGFKDETGMKLSVFSSDAKTANRQWPAAVYRVGLGNRLTTARPDNPTNP